MTTEIVVMRLNLSLPDDKKVWEWMNAMCPEDKRGRKQYLSRMIVSALTPVAKRDLLSNTGGVSVNFPPIREDAPASADAQVESTHPSPSEVDEVPDGQEHVAGHSEKSPDTDVGTKPKAKRPLPLLQ